MTEWLFDRLKSRHRELEGKIAEELSSRVPDTYRLRHLKKQKLAVRDVLQRISQSRPPRSAGIHAT
jgi:hypothetical protein